MQCKNASVLWNFYCTVPFGMQTKLQEGKVFRCVWLFTVGAPCNRYLWCNGHHCTDPSHQDPTVQPQGGAAWQTACELTNLKFWLFSSSFFTIDFKYAYMLDVLIPHIVHMTYFDTLCQFFKTLSKQMCNELHSSFLQSNLFFQSFGELTRCSQNMSCGQC